MKAATDADMVKAATELLQLSRAGAENVSPVLSNVEAAFTAALSVLDECLAVAACQDQRIRDLEKEEARLKTLGIFREPIDAFRVCVAERTGRATWQALARDLYVEQYKQSKPARADVASALSCMGLDLSVWDGIRQVADAGFMEPHQGQDMHPRLLSSMVSSGVLPQNLWTCNDAMTCMLDWLDNAM